MFSYAVSNITPLTLLTDIKLPIIVVAVSTQLNGRTDDDDDDDDDDGKNVRVGCTSMHNKREFVFVFA